MIAWESQYELGIKTIDDQHKVLVDIISKISELLTNATEGDDIYDDMMVIVDELTKYTIFHFETEEKYFDSLEYEFTNSHVNEHKKLIDEIQNLDFHQAEEDQVVFGKKILKFLISWLFKHISGTDFLYKEFFIANGVK